MGKKLQGGKDELIRSEVKTILHMFAVYRLMFIISMSDRLCLVSIVRFRLALASKLQLCRMSARRSFRSSFSYY